MSDKSAKMLERVRALLAKAASTEFAGEADARLAGRPEREPDISNSASERFGNRKSLPKT